MVRIGKTEDLDEVELQELSVLPVFLVNKE